MMYHLYNMANREEPFIPMAGLALIGVPSSAGARQTGQEGAPAALRAAGLLERLRVKGLDVADLGDLPSVSYSPDPEHPRQQNLALVVDVAQQAADRVADHPFTERSPQASRGCPRPAWATGCGPRRSRSTRSA